MNFRKYEKQLENSIYNHFLNSGIDEVKAISLTAKIMSSLYYYEKIKDKRLLPNSQ